MMNPSITAEPQAGVNLFACPQCGKGEGTLKAALTLTDGLSEIDRTLIFGGTAAGFYGI